MKKVWKYIVITLLLLLGLCCVGILYLFFLPGSSLFNITYINKNDVFESHKYEQSSVSRIDLNSRAYEVNIVETEEDEISLKVYSNSFGFVLKKNSNVEISSKIQNNILTFNIIEPHGFATQGNSYIELKLPANLNIDLNLTNKKAKTTINSENLKINNLTYKTETGDFYMLKGSILGELNLNIAKGDFNIDKNVVTSNNDVNLKLTSGKFNASNAAFEDVRILQNKRGVISIKECVTLNEILASAGGRISIEKVAHINVSTSDTNISIGTVDHGAIIDLTKSGNIKIGTLNASSVITTYDGSINIGESNSVLTVSSNSGNIKISSAKLEISANTNYGDISIHFAEDAQSYLDNNQSRVLHARIKNGKLTATGVEHIGEADADNGIKISGNGRAYITMKNVYGTNQVSGNNGEVKVVINKDSSYELTTSSKSGGVRVNLTQTTEYNGYTTKEIRTTKVNCDSSTNNFTVSTNQGNLIVLDTNFA